MPVVKQESDDVEMEMYLPHGSLSDPDGSDVYSALHIGTPAGRMSEARSVHHRLDQGSSTRESELQRIIAEKDTKIAQLERQLQQSNLRATTDHLPPHSIPEHVLQHERIVRYFQDEILQIKTQLNSVCDNVKKNTDLTNAFNAAQKRAEQADEKQAKIQRSHQKEVEKLQDYINGLKSNISQLKKQNSGFEKKLVPSNIKNTKTQPVINSSKVSDDAILSLWQKMAYNIQNLAATILTGCPSLDEMGTDHKHEPGDECAICRQTSKSATLLLDEDFRSSAVESLIWRGVYNRIFHVGGKICAREYFGGIVGGHFIRLLDKLLEVVSNEKIDPGEIMLWKSTTSAMIERMVGKDHDQLQENVFAESMGLSSFLTEDQSLRQEHKDYLFEALSDIFQDAAELQAIFLKSRAHFLIYWTSSEMPTDEDLQYHPEHHKAEQCGKKLSKDSIVKLEISPSLFKVGNADGNSYIKSSRLVKSAVVCD